MIYEDGIKVIVADASHEKYVDLINDTIRDAARKEALELQSVLTNMWQRR